MHSARAVAFTSLVAALALAATARADNWPAWRGPTGQGHSAETNLPLEWSATKNVKWKVALKDPGNSTPVIWGDRIFLTQANKDKNPKKDEKGKVDNKARRDGTVRSLICFSRKDGTIVWQKDVNYDLPETNWGGITYANASPATDGERVVATFGSAGVYCYDLDGKELWKRTDLGRWEDPFGQGASPVIYKDLVIQWCGPNRNKGRNFLIAVEKTTGKTVWEHDESFGSWSTPVVVTHEGKDQLLLGQSLDIKGRPENQWSYLKGFDPKTGSELWKCQGLNSFVYSSPLYADGVAVNMSGFGGSALGVKLGGAGDITKDRLWLHPRPASQRVGSGVIVGEHVYMVDENLTPHCYELKTGKDLWQKEDLGVKGVTWGSLVHADGRLYLLLRNGQTVVLAAKPKFEILATNSLGNGENSNSSVAISDGEIYIRTFRHLWCISEKK